MSTLTPRDRKPAYCGVDVGTQGVRSVVVTAEGRCLGSGSVPLAPGDRSNGRHEQDPAAWWGALTSAVRAAVSQAGDSADIRCIALDATSGTVLVEDADGVARGPALMYDDSRAREQTVRAQLAGAPLWDTLGYRMQPSWALPKLMWLLEHDAVGPGDRVVHQSDHLLRKLTGSPVATDCSHALKTGVDLRDISWPAEIFHELHIEVAKLPEVVLPGTEIGQVGVEGSVATGLAAGTPVRAGMTDGCAAQIATGALKPGSWSSALGTTLVIKGSTKDLIRDPHGAVYSHRNPDGGWLPGGASSTGAGAISQQFPGADQASLNRLTDRAAAEVPVSGATYALAGTGERFPFVAPQAHGFLDPEAIDEPQRFAALCQSIAYIERLSYDVLGVLGADVSGPVALTGGATGNSWWNQLRTDTLGRATFVPTSAQAANGMAILAAAPEGELAPTAERMVEVGSRYRPDPSRAQVLRPGYERLLDELVDRQWLDGELAARALATAGSHS
jgi:sugar (pentulose or hexulose) kinase